MGLAPVQAALSPLYNRQFRTKALPALLACPFGQLFWHDHCSVLGHVQEPEKTVSVKPRKIQDVCLEGPGFTILMPEFDSILPSKLHRILQIAPDLASRLEAIYKREHPSDA